MNASSSRTTSCTWDTTSLRTTLVRVRSSKIRAVGFTALSDKRSHVYADPGDEDQLIAMVQAGMIKEK